MTKNAGAIYCLDPHFLFAVQVGIITMRGLWKEED